MKLGFDHDKYTAMQSERIIQRIDEFGGKLYLELGGKLFDDFHASRVLPGFQPDSKVQMLLKMKDKEMKSQEELQETNTAIGAFNVEGDDDAAPHLLHRHHPQH